MEADLHILQDDRVKFHNNPLLGYLNINSLRNKVTNLIIFKDLSLDYFVLSETKLDKNFPTAQFTLEGCRIRSDGDKYDGGLIEFLKDGFIGKTIPEYTSDKTECICSEFTISKDKWICFSIYRPPVSNNLTIFFEELAKVLSKVVLTYENIIPLDGTHLDAVRGLIQTKRFHPSASTKRAQLSFATTTIRSIDLFNIMSSPESMLIRQD